MEQVATEGSTTVFEDRFSDGLDLEGRWALMEVPPAAFSADDGTAERGEHGLRIAAGGVNPSTGEPAFTKSRNDSLGHVKWMASPRAAAAGGFPGFDVPAQGALRVEFRASGRTYGTDAHPFGDHVADPKTDLRLASGVLNAMDYESGVVFDFWITSAAVYPFYERLLLPGSGASHQAFTSIFEPIARTADQVHDLALTYDSAAGTAVYTVDGREVARVDDVGVPAPGAQILVDHGGTPSSAAPRQLLPGLALMTYMDGPLGGSEQGLVALDVHYESPTSFVGGSELFGQGAEITVEAVKVTRT